MVTAIKYQTAYDYEQTKERRMSLIDKALVRIKEQTGRDPTANDLLKAATDKRHPLHKRFEWDNTKAGHKYRLEQARAMIATSKLVVFMQENKRTPAEGADPHKVRTWVQTAPKTGFKMRNEVLSNKVDRQLLIARKLEELRAWCNSIVDVSELTKLRQMIEANMNKASR